MTRVAEHDENDEQDGPGAGPDRGEKSVTLTDDPPTLPPFAADGPRPATIHGFPAVEAFPDNLGDLFDVPKLGSKAESTSGRAPAVAPPVPALASRTGGKAPATGPVPIIPQSRPQSPVVDSRPAPPPLPREATPGPQLHDVSDPKTMPPASSLIEKIRAAKRRESEATEEAPKPEATVARPEPKPAATKPAATKPSTPKPQPRVTAPKPPATTAQQKPEPTKPTSEEKSEVWLEPVPLASLDRRDELRSEAPREAESATLMQPLSDVPVVPQAPTDERESESTAMYVKPTGRLGVSLPAPKPVLAPPPPPTAVGHDGHQPPIGAPYQPPALVLERSDDASATEPSEAASAPAELEPPRPRLPAPGPRLPAPGPRRPPLDPVNPILAAKLASSASEPPIESMDAVPEPMVVEDTAALVSEIADEIIREAEPQPAANKAPDPDAEIVAPREAADDRGRKFALYFLGVAAVLSLIVALLPSKNPPPGEQAPPPADAPKPEPDPSLPDGASAGEPTPNDPPIEADTTAVEADTTAVEADTTAVEADAGADAGEPEPQPEPVAEPQPSKSKQPKPKPKPTPKPKPEPKPEPKPDPTPAPTPGGPNDPRSADELYTAAKSAYNSGKAAEAYKLAYASWRKKDKSKTAELMTLAACKLKDKTKAKSSLAKVSALRRNGLKKECAAMGLSL